jgi:putative DeoR family transcriptional regulator (stage III sporulation protein D)
MPKISLLKHVSDKRCEILARYITENSATVRDAASYFGISKSTVHKDITEKLKKQNLSLYESVREILDKNKSERHLRGGNATKLRYERIKKTAWQL